MAYDEHLANRIRELIAAEDGVTFTEQKMFGGLAFLINGNLAASASGRGGLLLRVPPNSTEALLREPHTQRVVMAGRETNGWIRVDTDSLESEIEVASWIGLGVTYARSLPPK
jgi:hypothetical protein